MSELSRDVSPAIVVVAFNRPSALTRLLRTLDRANYGGREDIQLVISLDFSDERETAQIANSFEWKAGPKRIIEHRQRLGLKNHVMSCADLASEYGAIILLEDDLAVAPEFYNYSRQALAFYHRDPAIAGISLYSFVYNEFANIPFRAIDDGNEVYFVRSAVSWGQIWTADQWAGFRAWFDANGAEERFLAVPKAVKEWRKTSWKKYFNAYLAAERKYFVVPRYAMSTNTGESGTHFPSLVTYQTAPLAFGHRCFRFTPLGESRARYDAFFEIEPECLKSYVPALRDFDFCTDLNGTKEASHRDAPYVLTSRAARNPAISYGFRHFPPELNVILEEPGNFLHLARSHDARDLPAKKVRTMRYFFVRPFRRWF